MKPHWRRAPVALRAYPSLFVVVLLASLLVALATATAPFFAAASGNAALKTKLIEIAPLGGGLEVIRTSVFRGPGPRFLAQSRSRGRALANALDEPALTRGRIATLLTDPVRIISLREAENVRLLARTNARLRVQGLNPDPGRGFWIPDTVFLRLQLPDGRLDVQVAANARRATIRLANAYRALSSLPPSDYWVNFTRDIYPYGTDRLLPPPFLIGLPHEVADLYARVGGGRLREFWEFPVDSKHLTVARAQRLERRFDDIRARLGSRDDDLSRALGCFEAATVRCEVHTSLPAAIGLARRDASAVSAPTKLLGDLGALVAIAAVGAAGAFLVARRRSEARVLYAWGERASAFGARTIVEAALPTLLGGAAGFGIAWLAVRAVGEGGALDRAAVSHTARDAAIAVGAGLALLGLVAARAYLRQDERASERSRLARVPWELVLIAAAVLLLLRVRSSGGFVAGEASGGGHPSLAVFLLPLVLVSGTAMLVLRGGRALLRLARREPRSVALYLASRRLAYASGRFTILATLCAVSLGALFYAATLATSLDHAVTEKAYIAVGGDVQATIAAPSRATFPFPLTFVRESYGGAAIGSSYGAQVDLIGVDPATLASVVHWDGSWGAPPARWLGKLAARRDGRLPVVATRGLPRIGAIWIDGNRVPAVVVARLQAFPGMSRERPLLVASSAGVTRAAERAGGGDPFESAYTVAWARGPADRTKRALQASPLLPVAVVSIDDVRHDPDVTISTRTYGFLRGLGIALGVVTLLGVVLYLTARQRAQAMAAAFAQRMGLRSRTAILSLWIELLVVLIFAATVAAVMAIGAALPVVRRTDPLPTLAPAPSAVVPTVVVWATFLALAVASLVATVYAERAARRADVGEELRLA